MNDREFFDVLHQVWSKTTYPKGYMDRSMVSNAFGRLTDSAVRELYARGELN